METERFTHRIAGTWALRPPPGIGAAFLALGWLMLVLALGMLAPAIADAISDRSDWIGFVMASGITAFFAITLILVNRRPDLKLNHRTAFLLTSLSWFVLPFCASLPFHFGSYELSVTDAVFETVSGITTTGSTVIKDLDAAPIGLLIWRSVLQWLGGLGIIMMAIIILPWIGSGGMQLFRTESSDRAGRLYSTARGIVWRITLVYSGMTMVCAIAYALAGMTAFDAVNHALTTLPTGGFSPRDGNFVSHNDPAIEWVATIFMLAACLPFLRYAAIFSSRWGVFTHYSQILTFLGLILVIVFVLTAVLSQIDARPVGELLRRVAFTTATTVSGTGFAVEDFTQWGPGFIAVFLILAAVGGCTGSSTGGIKIFRFEILWKECRRYVHALFAPQRILRPHYEGRPIRMEIVLAVLSLFFLFITSWVVCALVLTIQGLDLMSSLAAALTFLSNCGPGSGDLIGPIESINALPESAKWTLSLAMLLGRLEFFSVLVVLHPAFWRR